MSADSTPPTPALRSLRGAFITFEGIDGCGKTTQARMLAEKLRAYNFPVVETREPGGTPIGKDLRAVLLDPGNTAMTPHCELMLYLADRMQHLAEVIRPAMARGDTVICDRYHDATVAYQFHGRGLDFAPVQPLIAAEIETSPPDLTFWMDVNLETAQSRIEERSRAQPVGEGGADFSGNAGEGAEPHPSAESRLEQEDVKFHLRVMIGYEQLYKSHPQRIARIDGAVSIDAIHEAVWEKIGERFHVI